jgi:hypothetical protein
MKTENYLSKLIFVISVITSILVFLVFPTVLEKGGDSSDDIEITTMRSMWDENKLALPTPTQYAVSFTDHGNFRIALFFFFLAAGLLLEILCKNRIMTGTYHSVYLLTCIMIGSFFFTACLLPFMPL